MICNENPPLIPAFNFVRRILTRENKPLFLPTEEAAMIVASDWDIQEGKLSYATMPLVPQHTC